MSEELAALFALSMVTTPMVKPHIPFSPLDFHFIEEFGPKKFLAQAGAGAAISETIYTVPDHKMMLLLSASILTQKTTATAVKFYIKRKVGGSTVHQNMLINEDSVNNTYLGWPSSKPATASNTLGWHMCFLFEGDILYLSHALTAAETIADTIVIQRILYPDPRYKE